jgi:hypothetical protein
MNNKQGTHAESLKSRSRGTSRDMSPDAINRRLDIVDELREFALELRDSTRLGPIEKPSGAAGHSGKMRSRTRRY